MSVYYEQRACATSFRCIAGGASNPRAGLTRLALNFVYCCGWLQQQENQYLGVAHREVVQMSPTMQSLLGYREAVDFVR